MLARIERVVCGFWWYTIAAGLVLFWGACFPSVPSEQPALDWITTVALVLGVLMCLPSLLVVFIPRLKPGKVGQPDA